MSDGSGHLSRGWRIVLVLSLALNLLVAGALVGRYASHGGAFDRHQGRYEPIGGPLTGALSQEDRREITRQMRDMRHDKIPDKAARRAVYEALLADLRAEPLDSAAIADHMARQRDLLAERLAVGQALLLDRIERMSAVERAAFADRLAEGLRRRDARP